MRRLFDGAGARHPSAVRGGLEVDHHVGVAIDDDIRVVGGDDHLAPPTQFPERRQNRVEQKPVVEFVLRLVNDKGKAVVRLQKQRKKNADPSRKIFSGRNRPQLKNITVGAARPVRAASIR